MALGKKGGGLRIGRGTRERKDDDAVGVERVLRSARRWAARRIRVLGARAIIDTIRAA